MDEQGMFHLKNTGKFPILNNGSEVPPGMQVSISSGCLIDVCLLLTTSFNGVLFAYLWGSDFYFWSL